MSQVAIRRKRFRPHVSFVRRLMGGPLLSNRRLSLIEGGGALGELGLKRGVLSPQSFRIRLEAQRLFLPAKRFAVELLALFQDCGPNLSGSAQPAPSSWSR